MNSTKRNEMIYRVQRSGGESTTTTTASFRKQHHPEYGRGGEKKLRVLAAADQAVSTTVGVHIYPFSLSFTFSSHSVLRPPPSCNKSVQMVRYIAVGGIQRGAARRDGTVTHRGLAKHPSGPAATMEVGVDRWSRCPPFHRGHVKVDLRNGSLQTIIPDELA